MFKINKHNITKYICYSIIILSIFTTERAECAFAFNQETVERIEFVKDVDLDIYLDVGVHNEIWQQIVKELHLEEPTELASHLEGNRSVGKMCNKLSRYIGKKIQKILAKYSDLDSIKSVDDMAYAMAHFKLDLNKYVKTGKLESNFKILDIISKDRHTELAQYFKKRAIFYYKNEKIKPSCFQNRLFSSYEVNHEANKEAGLIVPPELVFATFAISAGTAIGAIPHPFFKAAGGGLACFGMGTWYSYTKDIYSDGCRERAKHQQPIKNSKKRAIF